MAVNSWQLFDIRSLKRLERLQSVIPEVNTTWIFFNEEYISKFRTFAEKNMVKITSEEDAKALKLEGSNIVLADLPPSKAMLAHVFSGKKPARIYAHFYKEDSDYFSTIPTRDHFKWYFALLAKKARSISGVMGMI